MYALKIFVMSCDMDLRRIANNFLLKILGIRARMIR